MYISLRRESFRLSCRLSIAGRTVRRCDDERAIVFVSGEVNKCEVAHGKRCHRGKCGYVSGGTRPPGRTPLRYFLGYQLFQSTQVILVITFFYVANNIVLFEVLY